MHYLSYHNGNKNVNERKKQKCVKYAGTSIQHVCGTHHNKCGLVFIVSGSSISRPHVYSLRILSITLQWGLTSLCWTFLLKMCLFNLNILLQVTLPYV